MCRGQITYGLFRMKSFGEREERNIAEQIQTMRSERRNAATGMSEWNFVALIIALISLTNREDDHLYISMPECVQEYLDSAEDSKRKEWYNKLRMVTRNLHYEMLNDEIPIERNGCRTSCAAEDAILYIIWKGSGSGGDFSEDEVTRFFCDAEELLKSSSKVDPKDDEDNGEYNDEQEREDVETGFSDAISGMMDDMDIAVLWEFKSFFFVYDSVTNDYACGLPSGAQLLYSSWIKEGQRINMIDMHPDCWFIGYQEKSLPLGPEVDSTDNAEIVGEKIKIGEIL